jgi:hypothetical protein
MGLKRVKRPGWDIVYYYKRKKTYREKKVGEEIVGRATVEDIAKEGNARDVLSILLQLTRLSILNIISVYDKLSKDKKSEFFTSVYTGIPIVSGFLTLQAKMKGIDPEAYLDKCYTESLAKVASDLKFQKAKLWGARLGEPLRKEDWEILFRLTVRLRKDGSFSVPKIVRDILGWRSGNKIQIPPTEEELIDQAKKFFRPNERSIYIILIVSSFVDELFKLIEPETLRKAVKENVDIFQILSTSFKESLRGFYSRIIPPKKKQANSTLV